MSNIWIATLISKEYLVRAAGRDTCRHERLNSYSAQILQHKCFKRGRVDDLCRRDIKQKQKRYVRNGIQPNKPQSRNSKSDAQVIRLVAK